MFLINKSPRLLGIKRNKLKPYVTNREVIYSSYKKKDATSFELSTSQVGKMNIGIRANSDIPNRRFTKNGKVVVSSKDNSKTSELTYSWSRGEGYSINGVYDSIAHQEYQDPPYWNIKPSVVITFDDGWESMYNLAFPYMRDKGIKGTAYVVPNNYNNTPGFVTDAHLKEMYDAGWCIANHTNTHPFLTNFTYEQAYSEIDLCNQWLESKGYHDGTKHIAFPYGSHNDEVLRACKDLGMDTVRFTGNELNNIYTDETMHKLKPITCGLGGACPDFNAVKLHVDEAISKGKVCVMMFHRIVNAPGENGWPSNDGMNFVFSEYKKVMDYLVQINATVYTMDELLNLTKSQIDSYKSVSRKLEFDNNFVEIQRIGKKTINGSLTWTTPAVFQTTCYRSQVTGWNAANSDVPVGIAVNSAAFSNLHVYDTVDAVRGNAPNLFQFNIHTNGNLYLAWDKAYGDANGITTQAALKTWLNNNPITLLFEQKTPTITPAQVSIVTNGISDTSLRSFGNGTKVESIIGSNATHPVMFESHPI
ncbi:polysaccharide deacetylase family protein [Paenibacillus sp. JSM ZJ436]|uniref:polysaccharide deacetylase family protein n=1 Tax=Paenibacillus sp. JSM ZJ436 TaxID=3376190 RepID=UPI0037BBA470